MIMKAVCSALVLCSNYLGLSLSVYLLASSVCSLLQLSCCLFPLLAHLQGHFLQKELHCLQANQVSELLLDMTSSWTQNCTSSNTLLPLYRLVCKEFSEVSILCYTRLDLQILPSLLWGKCTAGFGDFWIMGLCFWEQLRSSVNSTEIFRGRRSSDGAQLPSSQMAELWLGYFLAGAGGAASLLFCSISGWVLVYNYGKYKGEVDAFNCEGSEVRAV